MLRNLALAAAAATIATTGLASAADLPSKKSVPTLAAAEPSAIHGFMDFGYANGRVTGGGVPLYPKGATLFQSDVGVSIDLYGSKTGFINSVSAMVGAWAESRSDVAPGKSRMQEYDWWAGATVGFADYYKLTVESLQFQIPGAGVKKNIFLSLSYDDAHLGLPIALNPSVSVIYNQGGGLTLMGLGKNETYRVDLGIAPGYSFQKSTGIPLSFSVPTSISLGPKKMYYASSQPVCGPNSDKVCSTSTFQMFSTGLQAKYDLGQFIPKKFGAWTAKAGVQYYHLMSDAVQGNQVDKVGPPIVLYPATKSNFTVISAGLGVSF